MVIQLTNYLNPVEQIITAISDTSHQASRRDFHYLADYMLHEYVTWPAIG